MSKRDPPPPDRPPRLARRTFEHELEGLQRELVLLQEYVKVDGLRIVVEFVMGFCTEAEYREFMRSCPEFERMPVRSGIILIKYSFSVSDAEQERRFRARLNDPMRRWKLSPMDLLSCERRVDYSRAKDHMFAHRARLNCIAHLLSMIPYQDVIPPPLDLPPRQPAGDCVRPPRSDQSFVPEVY